MPPFMPISCRHGPVHHRHGRKRAGGAVERGLLGGRERKDHREKAGFGAGHDRIDCDLLYGVFPVLLRLSRPHPADYLVRACGSWPRASPQPSFPWAALRAARPSIPFRETGGGGPPLYRARRGAGRTCRRMWLYPPLAGGLARASYDLVHDGSALSRGRCRERMPSTSTAVVRQPDGERRRNAVLAMPPLKATAFDQVPEDVGHHGDGGYPHFLHGHAVHGDRRRTGASMAYGHDHEAVVLLISSHSCGSSSAYPPLFCLNAVRASGWASRKRLFHLFKKDIAVHEADVDEVDRLARQAVRAGGHGRHRYGRRRAPRVQHDELLLYGMLFVEVIPYTSPGTPIITSFSVRPFWQRVNCPTTPFFRPCFAHSLDRLWLGSSQGR